MVLIKEIHDYVTEEVTLAVVEVQRCINTCNESTVELGPFGISNGDNVTEKVMLFMVEAQITKAMGTEEVFVDVSISAQVTSDEPAELDKVDRKLRWFGSS